MINRIAAITFLCGMLSCGSVFAQSAPTNPVMTFGLVPTVSQWIGWFQQKQDVFNFGTGVATLLQGASSGTGGPVGKTGPTLTGPIFNSIVLPTQCYHQSLGCQLALNNNSSISNNNATFLAALDSITWASGDFSQFVQFHIYGTPSGTGTITLNLHVGSTNYPTVVNETGGMTGTDIALAMCNAVNANTALLTALAAYRTADGWGYIPNETGCVNQAVGPAFSFDYPAQGVLPTVTSTDASIPVCTGSPTYTNCTGLIGSGGVQNTYTLDGNPYFACQRNVIGYTFQSGDQACILGFFASGTFGSSGALANHQIAFIRPLFNSPNSTQMDFATMFNATTSVDMTLCAVGLAIKGAACDQALNVEVGTNIDMRTVANAGAFSIDFMNNAQNTFIAGGLRASILSFGGGSSGTTVMTVGSGCVTINGASCLQPFQILAGTNINMRTVVNGSAFSVDFMNTAQNTFIPGGLRGSTLTFGAGSSGTTVLSLGSATIGFYSATPVAQATGYGTPTNLALAANFPGTAATLSQTAGTLAQLITDLKATGIIGN